MAALGFQLKVLVPPQGRRVNIVLFGEPGLGKSSFVATACRAFNPGHVPLPSVLPMQNARATNSHTANVSTWYLEGTNIALLDVFGWRPDHKRNYTPDMFLNLLRGNFDEGVRDPSQIPGNAAQTNPSFPPPARPTRQQATAAIFFIPADNYESDLSEASFLERWNSFGLKEFVEVAKAEKVNVVFVINQVDILKDKATGQSICNRHKDTVNDVTSNPVWAKAASFIQAHVDQTPLPCTTLLSTEYDNKGDHSRVHDFVLSVLLAAITKPVIPRPYPPPGEPEEVRKGCWLDYGCD